MALLHVYVNGAHVAMINKQCKMADGHIPETPWLLLHNNGKTRRFGSFAEAKDEAQKVYPGVRFARK